MDWAGRTEGLGNASEIVDSFFHPSGPSEIVHLIQHKVLIWRLKLSREADRMPFHPGNPGIMLLAKDLVKFSVLVGLGGTRQSGMFNPTRY